MSKKRLDQCLVDLNLAINKSQAQGMILAGNVFLETTRLDKAGTGIKEIDFSKLRVKGTEHPWVSRGGMKLDHAFRHFNLSAQDKICVDIGASTGGFTDVLLKRGAQKIYAIDVGQNQLAWKLRKNNQVASFEKTNARHLTPSFFKEDFQIIVCDASFISLTLVLDAILNIADAGTDLIALIKPQFEAGKGMVPRGGVVIDPKLHQSCCDKVTNWLEIEKKWYVLGLEASPIKGPKGNTEFLIWARKN